MIVTTDNTWYYVQQYKANNHTKRFCCREYITIILLYVLNNFNRCQSLVGEVDPVDLKEMMQI